jgi:hypothetical protein
MLNPNAVRDAVVGAIQALQPVIDAIPDTGAGGIAAYCSKFPDSINLRRAIHDMSNAGLRILVVYFDLLPQGRSRPYAHRVRVYLRPRAVSIEEFAHTILTATNGDGFNIRQYSLLPQLETMEPPNLVRVTDEEGEDYFYSDFILYEIGDV